MNREIVLIFGRTGWGKSLWAKLYAKYRQRILIYDPAVSYDVKFLPIEEIVEEVLERDAQQFRLGSWDPEHAAVLGHLSYAVGKNTLLLEECSMLFTKGQRELPTWAKRICFVGRHRECSLVLIAQRPASVPIDFRTQANRIVSFAQHEGDDLGWLGDFLGRERMKELPHLQKWECIDYHNGDITRYSIRDRVERELSISLDIEQKSSLY